MIAAGRTTGAGAYGSRRTDAPVPVLIVDDDSGKRLALRSALAPQGYVIVEADSAIAALRCVMHQDFAVIILDVRMPVTNGFETATLIREREQSEATPIIFVTGFASDELDLPDRYAGGAVDFIFAPVRPDELRAKVSAFATIFVHAQDLAGRADEAQTLADQLRLLTDAAPIGIFQTDAQNRYVYTNPHWSEITGVRGLVALGRSWDVILDAEQRAALLTELATGDEGHSELGHRFEIRRPGGEQRIVLLTSRAVPDRDGDIAGWVGTVADVTAEADAEFAMSVARDAALAASAMQKTFAASASHELRTPTASILGYVEEIIGNDALSPEDRGFLDIVYRNAQRLSHLIDDLLVLDQAEVGIALMHPVSTALPPVVDRVVSTFAPAANRSDIALVTDYERGSPAAFVDPLRLEQVVTNLVSNALKFTPNGGMVKVAIRHQGDEVTVSVADTGVGIDSDDIEHIFDRFYRTKSAIDLAVQGSGLGLAIARTMIEVQGGQLRATSVIGQGSMFTVTLPIVARRLQVVG